MEWKLGIRAWRWRVISTFRPLDLGLAQSYLKAVFYWGTMCAKDIMWLLYGFHRVRLRLSLVSWACKRRTYWVCEFTHQIRLDGYCRTMFVVNICQDCILNFTASQIIRVGLQVPIASLHKLGCRKMLAKPIKIMREIRATFLRCLGSINNNRISLAVPLRDSWWRLEIL